MRFTRTRAQNKYRTSVNKHTAHKQMNRTQINVIRSCERIQLFIVNNMKTLMQKSYDKHGNGEEEILFLFSQTMNSELII